MATTIEAVIDIICSECGSNLTAEWTSSPYKNNNNPFLQVEPCQKCLDLADFEARKEVEASYKEE